MQTAEEKLWGAIVFWELRINQVKLTSFATRQIDFKTESGAETPKTASSNDNRQTRNTKKHVSKKMWQPIHQGAICKLSSAINSSSVDTVD